MSLVVEQVRRAEKWTATALLAPTVAPSADHTDGSWSSVDIYPAEFFTNVADKRIYTSDGVSIFSLTVRNFVELDDVPSSYAGETLKYLRVNAGETGLEFAAGTAVGLPSVLAIDATTGGNNIIMTSGDKIVGGTGNISAINMRFGGIDGKIRIRSDEASLTDYCEQIFNQEKLEFYSVENSDLSSLIIGGLDGFYFSSPTGRANFDTTIYVGGASPSATRLETLGLDDSVATINTKFGSFDGTKYFTFLNNGGTHIVGKMQLGARTTFDDIEGLHINQAATTNGFLTLSNDANVWMIVDQYAQTTIGNSATSIVGINYVSIVSDGGGANYNNGLAVNQKVVSTATEPSVGLYAKTNGASLIANMPNVGIYASASDHAGGENIAIFTEGRIHVNTPISLTVTNADSIRARGSNSSSTLVNVRFEGASGLTSDSFVVTNAGSVGIRTSSPLSTAYLELGDGVTSGTPVMRMMKTAASTAQMTWYSGGAQAMNMLLDASEDMYFYGVAASRDMYLGTNNTQYIRMNGTTNHTILQKTNGGLILNNLTTATRSGLTGEGLIAFDTEEDIFYGFGDGKYCALGNNPAFSISNDGVPQIFGAGPTKHEWAASSNYERKSTDFSIATSTDITVETGGVWEINVSLSLQSTGGTLTQWRAEIHGTTFLIHRQDFTLDVNNQFATICLSGAILDTSVNGNVFYVEITRISGSETCQQTSFNSWVTAKRII